jgi:hypothetical protein
MDGSFAGFGPVGWKSLRVHLDDLRDRYNSLSPGLSGHRYTPFALLLWVRAVTYSISFANYSMDSFSIGLSQLTVLVLTVVKHVLTRRAGWGRTPIVSLMLRDGTLVFIVMISKFSCQLFWCCAI